MITTDSVSSAPDRRARKASRIWHLIIVVDVTVALVIQ